MDCHYEHHMVASERRQSERHWQHERDFSFDLNPGSQRSGTLIIGGQTVTIIQAGSTYFPVTQLFTLVPGSAGLNQPNGIALDGAGNVYIADTINNAIKKWTLTNNSVSILATNSFGFPSAVAANSAGNVYFCLNGFNLQERVASSGTIIGLGNGVFNPANMIHKCCRRDFYRALRDQSRATLEPVDRSGFSHQCFSRNLSILGSSRH